MKKMLFGIILCLCAVKFANAQTFVKANAPYWMLCLPNVAVETRLSKNFTYNNDLIISPWKSIRRQYMMFGQFIPELRYYPKEAFRGFYAGAYGAAHIFKMTKWNYWNRGIYQKGWGFGAGLSLGYAVPLSDRWSLDTNVAGGWQVSRYRPFNKHTGEQVYRLNNSGEWIPYRIGITFACKVGSR